MAKDKPQIVGRRRRKLRRVDAPLPSEGFEHRRQGRLTLVVPRSDARWDARNRIFRSLVYDRDGRVVPVGLPKFFEPHEREAGRGSTASYSSKLTPGIDRPRTISTARVLPVSTKPKRKQLPLVDEGQGVRDRVVYSVPVKAPRAGEQIFAEAALRIRIGHLKHKVAVRNQIVLAEKPTATQPGRAARRITADKKRGKISL